MLSKESQLRSKRELIERFINDYMPDLPLDGLQNAFADFWDEEKVAAVVRSRGKTEESAIFRMIDTYNFTGKPPLREDVFAALGENPKLMGRKRIFERVVENSNR